MAERKNNQIPVDLVISLRNQGYSNSQIIEALKRQNYSLQEISDAMNQSEIKNSIDSPDIDLSNAPSPSSSSGMEFPNPPSYNQDDFASLGPYQNSSPQRTVGDYSSQGYYPSQRDTYSEKIDEIAEAIIKEKWEDLLKDFGDISIWKERVHTDILSIKQELLRTQERFESLQRAVVGKVSDYDKDIKEVGSEIKALEKLLEKIIDPLSSNIKELQKVTEDLKSRKRRK